MQKFARDLKQLFADINALDPTVMVVEGAGGQAVSGTIELDDAKMNQLLVQASSFRSCRIGRLSLTCRVFLD